jgi:hypothetical protein
MASVQAKKIKASGKKKKYIALAKVIIRQFTSCKALAKEKGKKCTNIFIKLN